MNLAITLLTALAIASVIGTVLQQNQPYQDYIIKFGPFWFDVFRSMGLYDVYAAWWFLAILGFLLVSVSTCVLRNGPGMLRDMSHFRETAQEKSLRSFRYSYQWVTTEEVGTILANAESVLKQNHYRSRHHKDSARASLAGMKGAINRLGYIFAHMAIVIICLGALFDSNVPMKWAVMTGDLKPETRDISASEVPAVSRISDDSGTFRSSVTIPENRLAGISFINFRDGYFVQDLPFTVEVKDFRVEHYSSGQPKSFESDLIVRDKDSDRVVEQTISVNHPLVYDGYTLYQASFGDGGSKLSFKVWPLTHMDSNPVSLQAAVNKNAQLQTVDGVMTAEFTDFRLFNINPAPEGSGKKFQNIGPSVHFKLRDAAGTAREFENYFLPLERDGRSFFMSGMRTSVAEPLRYLYLPADPAGGIDRFMRFLAGIQDDELLTTVAQEGIRQIQQSLGGDAKQWDDNALKALVRMVYLFSAGGFDAILKDLESRVPESQREQAATAYVGVLRFMLGGVYQRVLTEEGVDLKDGVTAKDAAFFDDLLQALEALPHYASPVFLQLSNFEHIQASGLQIARAPGKNIVYLGCVLLILGVFLMFYVPHRRLWLHVVEDQGEIRLVFAGSSARHGDEFEAEFETIAVQLKQALSVK